MFDEGKALLSLATSSNHDFVKNYPIIHYYQGYFHHKQGQEDLAKSAFTQARELSTDFCFPFRMETAKILSTALEYNPQDAKAHYYLGNIFFDHHPERAMEHWGKAVADEPSLAIAHRNLGWGSS